MDRKTWLSTLAESRVVSDYIKNGWEVYIQLSGKGSIDLIALKDRTVKRVQVKSTETLAKSGAYIVQLRSIRSNKTQNIIKKLDPLSYDELAVYIVPEDKIYYFTPEEVNMRDSISINIKDTQYRNDPLEVARMDEDTALKAAAG